VGGGGLVIDSFYEKLCFFPFVGWLRQVVCRLTDQVCCAAGAHPDN
jgi:hypothetical protein